MQGTRRFLQCAHQFLESVPAMLVIFKLIEAGAGWCEQYRIAFSRSFVGQFDGPIQRAGVYEMHSAVQLRSDFFRCRANEQNRPGAFA
jgi:hypothetical protein